MVALTQTKLIMVSVSEGIINISPNDRRNIYYFSEPTSGEFTITADTSSATFGDELVFILNRSDSDLIVNFPSDKFFLTYCGGSINTITVTAESPGGSGKVQGTVWIMNFYFNGTKFLSTWDTG
jgi:hypothetical protein